MRLPPFRLPARVALAALAGASVALIPPAPARDGGATSNTSAVTSAAWGVAPAATTVTSEPSCITQPATCGPITESGNGPWFFNVWNTGTVTITGVTYTVSFSGGALPSVTLAACSVPWTSSIGWVCSTGSISLFSNAGNGSYQVTTGLPSTAGSEVFIKGNGGGLVSSVTISTSVTAGSPRQIRAAQTTNA